MKHLWLIVALSLCCGCSYVTDELYAGSTPGKRGNRRNTIHQDVEWKFAPREYLRQVKSAYAISDSYRDTYPWKPLSY